MGIYSDFFGNYITVWGAIAQPFKMWKTYARDGFITHFLDPQLKSLVVQLNGLNISTTYMVCPKGKDSLGIVHPYMVMVVKDLKKYFSFEVTVLDSDRFRRRFRASNFESSTKVDPLSVTMPLLLSEGWNQIQFNLADFTHKAYNKQFLEVVSVKINANIRLNRIYFTSCLVSVEDLPSKYRLLSRFTKNKPETKQVPTPSSNAESPSEGKIKEKKPSINEPEALQNKSKELVADEKLEPVNEVVPKSSKEDVELAKDETPIYETAVYETAAVETTADETVALEKAAVEIAADDTVAGATVPDQKPEYETVVYETAAVETMADGPVVDEIAPDETPAAEPVVYETAVYETAKDETAGDETV